MGEKEDSSGHSSSPLEMGHMDPTNYQFDPLSQSILSFSCHQGHLIKRAMDILQRKSKPALHSFARTTATERVRGVLSVIY